MEELKRSKTAFACTKKIMEFCGNIKIGALVPQKDVGHGD
jgi:hypothetical protein